MTIIDRTEPTPSTTVLIRPYGTAHLRSTTVVVQDGPMAELWFWECACSCAFGALAAREEAEAGAVEHDRDLHTPDVLRGAPRDGAYGTFGDHPMVAAARLRVLRVSDQLDVVLHARVNSPVRVADLRGRLADARAALALAMPDDGGWSLDPASGALRTLVPRGPGRRRVR